MHIINAHLSRSLGIPYYQYMYMVRNPGQLTHIEKASEITD